MLTALLPVLAYWESRSTTFNTRMAGMLFEYLHILEEIGAICTFEQCFAVFIRNQQRHI